MCWWHPITILMTSDIKKRKWIEKKQWQIVNRRLIKGTVAQQRPKSGGLGTILLLPLNYVRTL